VLMVGLLFMEDREKRSAKERFFGLGLASSVAFVLPATQPGGDGNLKLSNRALEHANTPGWGSFRNAFASVLGTADVKAFSSITQKAKSIDITLGVQVDIDVIHLKRLEPLKSEVEEMACMVSFGSPMSNLLTKWICEAHMSDPILPRFTDNAVRMKRPSAGVEGGTVLQWSAEHTDYAILARFTDSTSFKAPATFFVCAGVDQAGSLFTAHKLFDDWETLLKETSGRDFVFVYEIDRANLTNEETYGQARVSRKSSFFRTDGGALRESQVAADQPAEIVRTDA
jgi:hypothetical protein